MNGCVGRLTRWLTGWSLKTKLIGMIMLTTCVALALCCTAFVGHEWLRYRDTVVREMRSLADIVAANSAAALAFEDPAAARDTLAGLDREPRVTSACLYDRDGGLFASAGAVGGDTSCPERAPGVGTAFTDTHLIVARPVSASGRWLGTVVFLSRLRDIQPRMGRYAGIAAGVLLMSLVVALGVSTLVQRVVSRPILELAETASRVSAEGDYEIRARHVYSDETGRLVDRFNEMMDQIHARDVALQRAQDELEDRVARRTQALEAEIGERRRVESRLRSAKLAAEQANQTKSQFLANMSHELRTPLNAIIGYAEMLTEDAVESGNEQCVSDLGKVRGAGRHLLDLINDVLDLSKIEAGQTEIHLETVAVGELIERARQTVDVLAQKNGNRLVVTGDDTGEMVTDPMKFQQSLLNLIANACKFTERGTVTLEVSRERASGEEWMRWQVTDTGIGIEAGQIPRLFQPFSQVDDSATRRHGGTGLGLAISRRYCRLLGGDITVESTPGEGSSFTIRVPATSKLPAPKPVEDR